MDDAADAGKQTNEREDALAVLLRLRQAGYEAYFAGGCVRDELLGLRPQDFDVATDAPPERVRELFSNTQAVGAAFGVILVRQRRSMVEVATFRNDGRYEDGRHPTGVKFSTAEEDARRRDFTINGLFLDPLTTRVIDYVGGQRDLSDRIIRAIGEPAARFEEDHLRLLRAIRFASRFGFAIEPVTAAAIGRDAGLIIRISPERIAEELRTMLMAPTRPAAWKMLWEFGFVPVMFRFLSKEPVGALEEDRSIVLRLPADEPLPFGALLAAAAICFQWQAQGGDLRQFLAKKPAGRAVSALRQALKLSNEESDQMKEAMQSLGALLEETPPTVARMKRFLALPISRSTRAILHAIGAVGEYAQRIDWL
ncbi:MAG TPA: CCA tRNA nucleotidyltransferase, partial [Tepidisphaeraceae bacterium]